jgi:aspartyl-tRNA(Asn)/glutamyl-tRNA(Gln) amidotransferase subunit C
MTAIDDKAIKHLAKLARIELTAEEETHLLQDLAKILHHFEELQALPTDNVIPMTGGTRLKNVFRNDDERASSHKDVIEENIQAQFPEQEKGFLKVPPVFSAEGGE